MIYDNPNPQYGVNMQEGILDGLRGTGYELVVHPCERGNPNNVEDVKAFASRLNLYCAILTPSISENDAMAAALDGIGCRYVRIASVALSPPDKMIVTRDREGGREAALHLVSLGHKHIAHLTGLKSFRSAFERLIGFEEALSTAGLSLDTRCTFEGDYTFESGVSCGEKLLGMREPPTAIFAANDEMAAGIIRRNDALEFSDWDDVMDVNLRSLFFLSQSFAKHLTGRKTQGKTINIACMLFYQGGIRVASYTGIKKRRHGANAASGR